MLLIAKNADELIDSITSISTHINNSAFPNEFKTYDEAWEELRLSIDHLRRPLGDARHAQLQDMLAQAKAHYDAEADDEQQGFLGSWLMQDIGQLVKARAPFAYPKELYRWPRMS